MDSAVNGPGRGPVSQVVGGGEMGALVRAYDWSQTELGPLEAWPRSLLTAVDVCLNSRFPMVVFWGKGMVTIYNDAYAPSFGSKHPRVLGALAETLWPEAWHLLGAMMRQVIDSGVATWSEDQYLLMDRHGFAEETYWTFSYSPIHGEGGGVEGVFTAVSETTPRVLGARRLRTLRELSNEAMRERDTRDILRVAADVLSRNLQDLPSALIYLGDTHQLRRLAASGPPEARASFPDAVSAAADAGQGVLFQVLERNEPVLREDPGALPGPPRRTLLLPISSSGQQGAEGVLVVGLNPHTALDESYRGFLGLVAGQLATALATARAYEEEKRRAEALARLDRAKTEFFSNVSHEFRTPLTLMIGPVEDGLADAEHPLPPVQRERQQLVHRGSLRLLKLVNTLLDFSRIEAGREQAAYAPTDLSRLTADLASTFRSAIEKAGLRLTVDCPPLAEAVWVDREMWEKVVLNLLSNAFKFTFTGEIAVTLRAGEGGVEFSVRDTGTGIPPEELDRVFERFHRVQGSRGRSYEGSGIGLSLVRELVRLHGGDVRVESTLGEGSVFTVSLPFGHAHLPRERLAPRGSPLASTAPRAEAYVQEARGWLEQEPEPAPAPSPAPRPAAEASPREPRGHVLLADDNADMRAYVCRLLEGLYSVDAVANGLQALEAARARPPDLVLSDVMMPGLDGFGLLRELKAEPRTASVPVILLSARAGEESKVEGLQAGADDYLVKPFGSRELLARVEGAVRAARARSERERLLGQVELARNHLRERADFEQQLIGIVSHDLRTPLGAILLGVAALLRGDELNARQTQSVVRIQGSAERATRMIRDLLDFTQARLSGGLRIERRAVDLHEILRGVLDEVEAAHPDREVRLSRQGSGRGEWDPDRLGQVVQNLVTNALKYSPAGTPVRIETRAGDGDVSLCVHNEGPPIPPERLASIFQPLQRGADEVDKVGRSIGLGLYIVKQVVDAHGGSVSVDSTPGTGTRFTVCLPRRPPGVFQEANGVRSKA